MNKPAFYNTNMKNVGEETGIVFRSHKGDVFKFVLTVIGVLSLLCIASKAWIWNDTKQIAMDENNEDSKQALEAEMTSVEMSYAYWPGKHDQHDRIHRDFFVWSDETLDVNKVQ